MSEAYIDQYGMIQRHGQLFPRLQFHKTRFPALLAFGAISIVCFLSNPANNLPFDVPPLSQFTNALFPVGSSPSWMSSPSSSSSFARKKKRNKVGSINLSWLGFEMDIFESPTMEHLQNLGLMNKQEKMTNFLLFSLSKRSRDGVYITALGRKWRLCEFEDLGGLSGPICQTIEENFCHEMVMFSPRYRPFTAYRLMLYFLLFNTLLHEFFEVKAWSTWKFLLFSPSLKDYIYTTLYLYPSLEILDKVIYDRTNNDSETYMHYFFNILPFFVIGAACYTFVKKTIYANMKPSRMGTYAAALGYQMSFQNQLLHKKILFRLWQLHMEFDASSVLLGHTLIYVFEMLSPNSDGATAGDLVIWILGGLAGKQLGDLHADHFGSIWRYWF